MSRPSKLTEIEQIISDLKAKRSRSIIFVCGPSGVGKSTLCESVATSFGRECVVFELDWYLEFTTRERWQRIQDALHSGDSERIIGEENPLLWYDWNSFKRDLGRIREHGNVDITIQNAWNQTTGKKNSCISLPLHDGISVVLCDGDYLLHPCIRELADLAIILDAPLPLCLERVEARDAQRSPKEYLSYKASLRERYDIRYFKKYRDAADIVIDSSGTGWKIVSSRL